MNGVKKNVILITTISLICKAIGFLKNSVLAYYFGSSYVVDAYVMVFAIGNIVFGWIGGFTGNFIPIYSQIREKKGEVESEKFANNIRNWLVLLVIILVIVFEFCGGLIVKIVAPGFDGEVFQYTVSFWNIYCVSLLFSLLYRLYKEYLNSKSLFVQAAAPDLLMSLFIMGSIIISANFGDELLIWGYVIAIGIEAIIEMICSFKHGHHFSLNLSFDENIRLVIVTVLPIFLGDCLTEINTFVDKMFASQLETGSVAVLDYAGTLKNLFIDVGAVAVTTLIFPKLSDFWVKGQKQQFVLTVSNGLKYVTLFFIPITIYIFVFGDNIISIIFKRGAFDDRTALMTTTALYMYSIGLLAMVYRMILNRVFLAMGKTKVILITGIVNVLVNVIMNYFLYRFMGHNGLALATSLAAIAVTITYSIYFLKGLNISLHRRYIVFFIKLSVASLIMGVAVYAIKFFVGNKINELMLEIVFTLILSVIGLLIYYFVLRLLKVKEINMIIHK